MEEEDANSLNFGKDFNSNEAEAVSISEVIAKLKEKHSDSNDMEIDTNSTAKETKELFIKYCEKFSKIKNKENIRVLKAFVQCFFFLAMCVTSISQSKMDRHNFHPFEMSQMLNLGPQDDEEARILIPTLKSKDESIVKDICDEIDSATSAL